MVGEDGASAGVGADRRCNGEGGRSVLIVGRQNGGLVWRVTGGFVVFVASSDVDRFGAGLFKCVAFSGAEMTAVTVTGGFTTPGGAVVFVGVARAAEGADGSCSVGDF